MGQRRLVVLALLVTEKPEVPLLDEPPEHLPSALADELTDALHSAQGAIVVASHDRWLHRTRCVRELRISAVASCTEQDGPGACGWGLVGWMP